MVGDQTATPASPADQASAPAPRLLTATETPLEANRTSDAPNPEPASETITLEELLEVERGASSSPRISRAPVSRGLRLSSLRRLRSRLRSVSSATVTTEAPRRPLASAARVLPTVARRPTPPTETIRPPGKTPGRAYHRTYNCPPTRRFITLAMHNTAPHTPLRVLQALLPVILAGMLLLEVQEAYSRRAPPAGGARLLTSLMTSSAGFPMLPQTPRVPSTRSGAAARQPLTPTRMTLIFPHATCCATACSATGSGRR